MALTNPDGTPYQVSGTLSQFNQSQQALCLFNQYDQELIQMGGSPILYYELLIQKPDPIYQEDRSKLFATTPVQFWAVYEPESSIKYRNVFGVDSPMEVVFLCNFQSVLNLIGKKPEVGSKIFTPHKEEMWKIIQCNTSQYQMWGEIRLEIICEKFQTSVTDSSSTTPNPMTDFKLR